MDTTETPKEKHSRRLSGRQLAIVVLVLLLAGGAVGAYYYRQRPEKSSDTNSQQTEEETTGDTTTEPAGLDDLKTRYELTVQQLKNVDGLSESEQAVIYARAAYDGAALDDAKAKDYAKTALELYGDQEPSADLKSYVDVLEEIAAGKYDTAKAIVLGETGD